MIAGLQSHLEALILVLVEADKYYPIYQEEHRRADNSRNSENREGVGHIAQAIETAAVG